MAASQDAYAAEFGTPLLFTLPSEQPADYRTPLTRQLSPLRDSGTISSLSARRSVTPPGSVHTDTTPPRPPPIMRLHDTLMTDVEPSGAASPAAAAAAGVGGSARGSQEAAAAAAGGGNMMRVEPHSQADDAWVTVYGFSPDDLPLVLRELQRCGDVLQWGTFGASPQSNFMHVQFQTKYGAQRALLRSGEQLSGSLIIGVKTLEARHKALVEAWSSSSGSGGRGGGGGGAGGTSPSRIYAPLAPARPYKVVADGAGAAQALPTRSTWMNKVSEFVFGI